ncbi:MAG: DoxX family protein [Patulibacter minatonensis]
MSVCSSPAPSWAPCSSGTARASSSAGGGGEGIAGTGQAFERVGLSPGEPLAVLAGAGEFFGGILLVLGLMTRLGALSVGASMTVAIVAMHLPGPFLGGYEFPLTLLGAAVLFLLAGPGRLSADAALRRALDGPVARTVDDGSDWTPRNERVRKHVATPDPSGDEALADRPRAGVSGRPD